MGAETENVIRAALDDAREEGYLDAAEAEEVSPDDVMEVDELEDAAEEEAAGGEGETKGEDEAEGEKSEAKGGTKDDKGAEKAAADEKKAKAEEEDDLGPEKNARGQENSIPYSRVVKITANKIDKALAPVFESVAKTLGLDLGKVLDGKRPFERIAEFSQTVSGVLGELTGEVQAMRTLEPLIREDGDKFIRILAARDPKMYGKFVDLLDGGGAGGGGGATKAEEVDLSSLGARPEADVKVVLDGKEAMVYSPEQQAKLFDWVSKKGALEGAALAEQKIGARLKPFEDERTKATESAAVRETVAKEFKEYLDEARSDWPGFAEKEKEIFEASKALPRTDAAGRAIGYRKIIRQAYNAIVIEGMKTDRTKMREELLAEIGNTKTPRSTTAGTSAAAGKKKTVVRGADGEPLQGAEASVARAIAEARAAGQLS